uniref:Uncharacterized protein n=1 Tax=Arundo donax TaxID=35708 RepID=A0A0A8ZSX3_ARUDO
MGLESKEKGKMILRLKLRDEATGVGDFVEAVVETVPRYVGMVR